MRTKVKFDKTDQPFYFENGRKYYGCPGCGASFKDICFCGVCNNESKESNKCELCGDIVTDYLGSGYCNHCAEQV